MSDTMSSEQNNKVSINNTTHISDIQIITKKDLHPTSHEFLGKFCHDADYKFLERFNRSFDDIAALKNIAYDENTNINETVLCLLRISELETIDLTTRLPIILYLQDKQDTKNAYSQTLYCLQNLNFTADDIKTDTETQTKLRMLYECHIENVYHLQEYHQVIQLSTSFLNKYGLQSSRIFHLSFFANVKLKRHKEALIDITRSIDMDPNNATLYNHRCFVYCEIGDFETALNDANKCLEIDPNHKIGLNNRGSVYNDLKMYELAIIDLDQAIKLSEGKNANVFRHRAYAYYNLGKYENAICDINEALNINKDYDAAKELKIEIWNNHKISIQNGVDAYCQQNEFVFLEPLVDVITDYIVGDIDGFKLINKKYNDVNMSNDVK